MGIPTYMLTGIFYKIIVCYCKSNIQGAVIKPIAYLEKAGKIGVIFGFCIRQIRPDLILRCVGWPITKIAVNTYLAKWVCVCHAAIVGKQMLTKQGAKQKSANDFGGC